MVRIAPHITAGERLLAPLERLLGVRSINDVDEGRIVLDKHIVLVGFCLAGRFAARTLRESGVQFVVLDLNAENVKNGKRDGLPVYYGDATSEEALRHAHVEHARRVVLLMNDPQAAERVVDTVKRVAPSTPILMRTRYLLDRDELLKLGAADVVAEEVEGAVEVISRMLRTIEVPRNVIDARIQDVRSATQSTDRKLTFPRKQLREISGLDEMKIESALVHENSAAAGLSSVMLNLRSETGALVVGARRGGQLLDNPDPNVPFEPGDVVYLVGMREAVDRALPLFAPTGGSLKSAETL